MISAIAAAAGFCIVSIGELVDAGATGSCVGTSTGRCGRAGADGSTAAGEGREGRAVEVSPS